MKLPKFKINKRHAIYISSVLIVALLIILLVHKCHRRRPIDKEFPGTNAKYVKVFESSFVHSVDISGYLEANDIQEVQFRLSGAITGVFVKKGDKVKKGQLLATIDDTNQRLALEKARQALEKGQLTLSEKEIELLRLSYKNAENNMVYTRATANFDGVVTQVNIQEGDYVEAGRTLQLIYLADLSVLKASVMVDEIDLVAIKQGMKCYLNFDSLPGRPVEATISLVPLLGAYDSSSGIGVKSIELTIENPPPEIFPGCSFSATITGDDDRKYVMIPNSAVKSSRGKTYVVRRNSDGTTENVYVTVRYLGEGLSQLLTGQVQVGDELLTNASQSLTEKLNKKQSGQATPQPPQPRF